MMEKAQTGYQTPCRSQLRKVRPRPAPPPTPSPRGVRGSRPLPRSWRPAWLQGEGTRTSFSRARWSPRHRGRAGRKSWAASLLTHTSLTSRCRQAITCSRFVCSRALLLSLAGLAIWFQRESYYSPAFRSSGARF